MTEQDMRREMMEFAAKVIATAMKPLEPFERIKAKQWAEIILDGGEILRNEDLPSLHQVMASWGDDDFTGNCHPELEESE